MGHHWILDLRTPYLTEYFKIYPYLAHSFFIMGFISIGYWYGKHRRFFFHLTMMIMISGMVNLILKGFFAFERPDKALHLVHVWDPFSFPSGDSQLATVLWGMIFMATTHRWLRALCAFIILNVMISRVYLGVHSVYDVSAGFLVGGALIYSYRTQVITKLLKDLEEGHRQGFFWGLLGVLMALYALCSRGVWTVLVPIIMGSLVGIGLSLSRVKEPLTEKCVNVSLWLRGVVLLGSVAAIVALSMMRRPPSAPHSTDPLESALISAKYAALVWCMLIVFPALQQRLYGWVQSRGATKSQR